MSTFNFNNPESEEILIPEESLTISDTSESSNKEDIPNSEKKRYFAYIGNFGGFAGLNTAVYVFYNRYHKKYYVGQTINLQARLNAHFQALDKGIHKNKEFQKDFDDIKSKGLDHQKEISGSVIYHRFHERLNTKEQLQEIMKSLVKKESTEIARLVIKGENVYNLDESIGIPCIIKEKFYISLESARQDLDITISINQIKTNLSNPDLKGWDFAREKDRFVSIPTSSSTDERPIKFINPFNNEIIILDSISSCARYLTENFDDNQKKEFRKYKIVTSRKRVGITCSQNQCKYLTFATKEDLIEYKNK